MSISLAVAIYFLVWWVMLFAVLPWGVRAQGEDGAPGTDPGAPQLPRLLSKVLWTTALATAVFGAGMFLYLNQYVTFDDLARLLGMPG